MSKGCKARSELSDMWCWEMYNLRVTFDFNLCIDGFIIWGKKL